MRFLFEDALRFNLRTIVNYMKGKPDSLYKLNAHITETLARFNNITNVIISSFNDIIYQYRMDSVDYYREVTHKYMEGCYVFEITVQFSKMEQGSKISMMYDKNGVTAERAPCLPKLTDILFQHQGISKSDVDVKFIEITGDPVVDLHRLKDAASRGYDVFVSAFGSGLVLYLSDLYFNTAPSGIYHVNGFSTSVKLFGRKNQIRLFPPDSLNPPIFVRLSTNDIVIIYVPTGVWSNSLATSIQALATGRNVTMIETDPNAGDKSYLEQLAKLSESKDPHTVIVLSDYAITIADNKFPYRILFGDASANTPLTSNDLLTYLRIHDTLIIQPFITQTNIAFSQLINRN